MLLPALPGTRGAGAGGGGRRRREPPRATAGTILLADDEESVRETTGDMLQECGYRRAHGRGRRRGRSRSSGPGAGELAAVLLDMTMPRMGGEEAFREMRRIDPGVPVILSSGYNEQDAVNRFTGRGLAGFIQKPYRMKALAEKINQALAARADRSRRPS